MRRYSTGSNPFAVEAEESGARESQEDGRVRRDDELRTSLDQLVHPHQQRQLSLGRESGLGFVQDVEPFRSEAVLEHGEERFAVGLLVW